MDTNTLKRINAGLAVLRIVIGIIFIAHGAQKLFVFGFGGVSGAFGQMGAPLPEITGPLTALVEFFGGLALVFGLLTRLAGVGIAIAMLGAIMIVHIKNGFFGPNGLEFPLALLAAAVTIALTGAGAFSLDRLISNRRGHTGRLNS